jgi:hypothetical protein
MDSRFRTVDDTYRLLSNPTPTTTSENRRAAQPAIRMKRLMRAVWRELGPTLELMHRSGFRYTPFL